MPATPARTYAYKEINANGTTVIKAGPGHLKGIVVNIPGAGTIKIADAVTDVAPYIAGQTAFALPAAGGFLNYDADFNTGLTIVIASMTAGSITVVFA